CAPGWQPKAGARRRAEAAPPPPALPSSLEPYRKGFKEPQDNVDRMKFVKAAATGDPDRSAWNSMVTGGTDPNHGTAWPPRPELMISNAHELGELQEQLKCARPGLQFSSDPKPNVGETVFRLM